MITLVRDILYVAQGSPVPRSLCRPVRLAYPLVEMIVGPLLAGSNVFL